MTFHLTSTVFGNGNPIPIRYTCQGENVSPPLQLTNAPAGTKSFALIMEDPDAPDPEAPKLVWDHWVVWNIPASVSEIRDNEVPAGAVVGQNTRGNNAYGGPCPPIGTHRYFFKAYALDTTLTLPPTTDKHQLLAAIKDHTLAAAELMGTYHKS